MKIKVALASACEVAESPLWCELTRRLYFVDIINQTLFIYCPESGQAQQMALPCLTSALALTDNPEILLLISDEGILTFSLAQARVTGKLCDYPEKRGISRSNEGMVSPGGDLYFGTMSLDNQPLAGNWYRFEQRTRQLHKIGAPVTIANTLCWHGDYLYFADSAQGTIYRTRDEMQEREICVQVPQGSPDGSTICAQGRLWNAQWGASQVACYEDIGDSFRLSHTIPLPVLQPTSVAFGAAELSTLFITSARWGLEAPDRYQGNLLQIEGAGQGRLAQRFRLG
ncbi:MAG: SMP-30/gluconolactonase/LRE family protein [Enterobacteriaceae bacterium]